MDHTETTQCSSSAQLRLKPKHGADKLRCGIGARIFSKDKFKESKLLLEQYPSLHEAASQLLFQQNLP